MSRFLIGFFLFLSSFSTLTTTYADDLARSDLETKISRIGILLNHQDFLGAQELSLSVQESYNIATIAWELSYDDFVTWIQILKIRDDTADLMSTTVTKRLEYYPSEKDDCALVTRTQGYSQSCQIPLDESPYIDHVDYAFRLLFARDQKALARKIRSLERMARTPQDYNDLGNLLGWYMYYYPSYGSSMEIKMQKLGTKIIKADPHWMNGYLLQAAYHEDSPSKMSQLCKAMYQNYQGDESRSEDIFFRCK